MECCEPAISKPPKGDWLCLICLFDQYDAAEMQKYLDTHKSPYVREKIRRDKVKTNQTPSGRKKTALQSDSSDDDLPLRSSSTEMGKSPRRKKTVDDLFDPLSKFFTPSNTRQSSTARKSYESLVTMAREKTRGRSAADKLVKRSRKELNRKGLKLKDNNKSNNNNNSSSHDDRRFVDQALPEHCSKTDLEWFQKSEEEAKRSLGEQGVAAETVGRFPPVIVIGKYQIETWYSAPYPQEYAKLPRLWICEFCLQYAKSRSVLERHMVKCELRSPPGKEIYRCGQLSVFEVDGEKSKLYCQNLCLLAKLFLDHKTLYYDVEPFLFYVLTVNDQQGAHLAGYFSKEKLCAQKYNVSCIMVMPTYQRAGYGRFLLSFSYLLSRREKQPGTPERPLSELGRLAYLAYWRDQVLDYLSCHPDAPSLVINDISQRTGMSPHDIAATMQQLGLVKSASDGSGRLVLIVDVAQLNDYREKIAKKPPLAVIDEDALRWSPQLPEQQQQQHQSQQSHNGPPAPVHNEYIEQMRLNPQKSEQAPKKRRRRKKAVDPWRRMKEYNRKRNRLKRAQEEMEEQNGEDPSEDEEEEEEEGDDSSSTAAAATTTKKRGKKSQKRKRSNGNDDEGEGDVEEEEDDDDDDDDDDEEDDDDIDDDDDDEEDGDDDDDDDDDDDGEKNGEEDDESAGNSNARSSSATSSDDANNQGSKSEGSSETGSSANESNTGGSSASDSNGGQSTKGGKEPGNGKCNVMAFEKQAVKKIMPSSYRSIAPKGKNLKSVKSTSFALQVQPLHSTCHNASIAALPVADRPVHPSQQFSTSTYQLPVTQPTPLQMLTPTASLSQTDRSKLEKVNEAVATLRKDPSFFNNGQFGTSFEDDLALLPQPTVSVAAVSLPSNAPSLLSSPEFTTLSAPTRAVGDTTTNSTTTAWLLKQSCSSTSTSYHSLQSSVQQQQPLSSAVFNIQQQQQQQQQQQIDHHNSFSPFPHPAAAPLYNALGIGSSLPSLQPLSDPWSNQANMFSHVNFSSQPGQQNHQQPQQWL